VSKSSTWFERIVKALPRAQLEALSEMQRPWQADRRTLETMVLTKDSPALRQELSEIVHKGLLP
jgi:hypothetical protein